MTDTDKLRQKVDNAIRDTEAFEYAISQHEIKGLVELLKQSRDALPVWVPVKQRLPEPKQDVVYYFEFTGRSVGQYLGDGTSNVFGGRFGFLTNDVTHWMPLPPAPETD